MRQLAIITFIALTTCLNLSANDTDSLTYENTRYIKQRVNYLINKLNKINSNQSETYRNIEDLQGQVFSNLENINSQIKKSTAENRDSVQALKNQLTNTIHEYERNKNKTNLIHYALHAISLVLILLLVFFIEQKRRRSLDYLISRTDDLSGQNKEVLEKAKELKNIKKNLKKMVKDQKKVKKRLKKK